MICPWLNQHMSMLQPGCIAHLHEVKQFVLGSECLGQGGRVVNKSTLLKDWELGRDAFICCGTIHAAMFSSLR